MDINPYYNELKFLASTNKENYLEGFGGDDIGFIYKANMRQKGFGLTFGGAYRPHNQIGLGVLEALSGLWRYAKPFITKGIKIFGPTAVDVISNTTKDVIKGDNLKTAAKKRIYSSAAKLFAKPPELKKRKNISYKIPKRVRSIPSITVGRGASIYPLKSSLVNTYPALKNF